MANTQMLVQLSRKIQPVKLEKTLILTLMVTTKPVSLKLMKPIKMITQYLEKECKFKC